MTASSVSILVIMRSVRVTISSLKYFLGYALCIPSLEVVSPDHHNQKQSSRKRILANRDDWYGFGVGHRKGFDLCAYYKSHLTILIMAFFQGAVHVRDPKNCKKNKTKLKNPGSYF